MSWQHASRFGLHSPRHFLFEVAGARREPWTRAIELGRHSGSTAQDADLIPSVRVVRAHAVLSREMPDTYAPLAKVERVCAILGDQESAIDAAFAARPVGGYPLFGGFEVLGRWPASEHAE